LQRSAVRARCGAQVGDYRSHDVRRCGLRRRVAIRQSGDRQQAEYGNQTKGGDTERESYLDKRERGRELPLHLR